MNRHPAPATLALLAGGELPLARRIAAALHVRFCARCRREAEAFRQAQQALQDQAGLLPPGIDWAALEAEMKANIRLGVAAGAIVRAAAEPAPGRRLPWRPAIVVAATLAVVVAVGWHMEQGRRLRSPEAAGDGVVLQATPEGLAVEWSRGERAVLGAGRPPASAAVSWDGSIRAPFVEEDTGQVTIYDVSAQ